MLLSACGGGGSVSSSSSSGAASSSGSSSSSGGSTNDTGATATYWVPFAVSPFGTGGNLGFGIFVVPSTAPDDTPAYVSYSDQSLNLGYGNGTALNASKVVTDYSPATFLFAALDASNNAHIYSLDLRSTAIPVPVQVSSLSMPIGGLSIDQWICDSQSGFGNVLQPITMFVVLHLAGSAGCNTTGDTWKVVHYTDSGTTAPLDVSITSSSFTPLYAPSGALTGLLQLNAANHNLYAYSDATFTSPTAVITGGGVSAVSSLYASGVTGAQVFAGTVLFLKATVNGTEQLYRLSYADRAAALIYTATGALDSNAVYDDSNLYFDDAPVTAGGVQSIWQVALTGGAPVQLFSETVPANFSPLGLVGANDSVLVVLSTTTPAVTYAGVLETLAVGGMSGTPQQLGPSNQIMDAFMLPTTPGMPPTDLVFADIYNDYGINGGPFSSTEIFGVDGSVRQPLSANSSFLPYAATPQSGVILQRAGFDSFGMNGTLQVLNLSTLTTTILFTPDGGVGTFGLSSEVLIGQMQAAAPVDPQGVLINLGSGAVAVFGNGAEQVTPF